MKNIHKIGKELFITSDEEIKEGDWSLMFDDLGNLFLCDKPQQYLGIEKGHYLNRGLRKVILTTDQSLDGVQAINDEFLEWYVKNPSCESVKVVFNNRGITGAEKILKTFGEYKIIIPKEEPKQELDCPFDFTSRCTMGRCDCKPKQETLKEAAEKYVKSLNLKVNVDEYKEYAINDFIAGAKYQAERMYSEEEVLEILFDFSCNNDIDKKEMKEWFEQFKKK